MKWMCVVAGIEAAQLGAGAGMGQQPDRHAAPPEDAKVVQRQGRLAAEARRGMLGGDQDARPVAHAGVSEAGPPGSARATMRAGMPTAVAPAGTSQSTTALAPITACAPIVTPPSTLAPAPMSTWPASAGAPGTGPPCRG